MKGQLDSIIIFFSDMMCSCCLVSTMWCFLRVFSANVLLSLASWTWKKKIPKFEVDNINFVGTNAGFSNYLCVSNIGWGLCDILDNPGWYKSHQPRPITVTSTLVIAHFTKTKSKNCLIINFEENNLKHTFKWTQFEVALGNQALHMQPTNKSVVCLQITN